jgi:hypothetical protein
MTVYELPAETKAAFGYTHKVVLTHEDLTDTDAAQTINLIPVVAGTVIKSAATRVVTDFDSSDAATISTTVEIGHDDTTPDADEFITSQQLNPSDTVVDYKVHPSTTPYVMEAGTAASPKYIQAAFACTAGDSLADHNVGELEVFLEIADVNAL